MYLVANKEYLYWSISGDTEVGNRHAIPLDGKEYSSTLLKGQVLLQLYLITKNRQKWYITGNSPTFPSEHHKIFPRWTTAV